MPKLTQKQFDEKFNNGELTNSEIIDYYNLSNDYNTYKKSIISEFTVSDELFNPAISSRATSLAKDQVKEALTKDQVKEQLFELIITMDFIERSEQLSTNDQDLKNYAYGVFTSDLDKLRISLSDMQGYNGNTDGKWYKKQDYQFISKHNEQAQQSLIRNQTWQQLEMMWGKNLEYADSLKNAKLSAIIKDKGINQIEEFKALFSKITSEIKAQLTEKNSYLPEKVRSKLINQYLAEDVKAYMELQLQALNVNKELDESAKSKALNLVTEMDETNIFQKTITINDVDAKKKQKEYKYNQLINKYNKNQAKLNSNPQENINFSPVEDNNPYTQKLLEIEEEFKQNLINHDKYKKDLSALENFDKVAIHEKKENIDRINEDIKKIKLNSNELADKEIELQENTKIYDELLKNYQQNKSLINNNINVLESQQKSLEDNRDNLEKQSSLHDFYTKCAKASNKILNLQFNYTKAVAAKNTTESLKVLEELSKYESELKALQSESQDLGLSEKDSIVCNLKLVSEGIQSYAHQLNKHEESINNELLSTNESKSRSSSNNDNNYIQQYAESNIEDNKKSEMISEN
ncbi:hypothetical protein [Cysteiniphilum sp. JM-1]|uniref:hypothetical protein n=1 Tax=Cysteiniphilum sp. JM-1 TaxID=2610891 RepID=UPI001247C3F8|nr:hypothetical protein [Cysteiniphilum sp. JM-1]